MGDTQNTARTHRSTRELLAECARILNRKGPDSEEVELFIREHESNQEFAELARISRTLKRSLLAPPGNARSRSKDDEQ